MTMTERQIRTLQPAERIYKVYDSKGLYLQVTPKGVKAWYYRYRTGGKEKKAGLGQYPAVSLADAREKADDLRRMVREGIDPMTERKESKRRAESVALNTLTAVLDKWFSLNHAGKADNTISLWEHSIHRIKSALGHRPVTELTSPELYRYIVNIRDNHGASVAHIYQSYLTRALQLAVMEGVISHNPARELRGSLPAQQNVSRPALPMDRIGVFWRELDNYSGMHTLTRYALKLIVLTFCRPGEICELEWADVDTKKARILIPAERMKMRRDHIVPLSRQVLALLDELREFSGNNRYLFPSDNKKGHVMPGSLAAAMMRMGYRDIACPHGFRAMASSTLNEHGFMPDVIERQLAHVERNKVRAAYNRAEHLEERTRMMQWYADFIDEQRQK